ncbi:Major Facilitator Superfamily [Popillia japonica]|uniref:Major Facilitator Superfamily n=1 Tax=Popillia japonica TaxID=7064 RepID=A0AAW1N4N8_POPJA
MVQKLRVPPDGGWGWMIVASHALHHLIAIPIMQTFGLLFRDTFNDLGFTATDTSLIMNTNAAFAMFMGILNGPLLRHVGYRKVSILGAFLTTLGVLLTAYAYTFTHYMIAYGLVTSLGIGMGLSSYPLALNSYFVKKRSIAAGYTMTICGLGPVLVPQLISFLLDTYGIKYSMVIMAAISSHTFVSAVLLQPVEWHMKEEIVDDEAAKAEKDKLLEIEETDEDESSAIFNKRMAASMLSLKEELEIESKYGMDTPLAGSLLSLHPVPRSRRNTLTNITLPEESNSALETSAMITHVNEKNKEAKYSNNERINNDNNTKVYDTNLSRAKKKKSSLMKRISKSVVKLFDLTLLKDRIFVNIVVGMSLAVFAELNFSILTPFIMGDYNLSTHQIATFISVLSTADILFRFIAPYVSDFFKKPVSYSGS